MTRTPLSVALTVVLTLGQVVLPVAVWAQVPLSRATVSALRNQVRLLPANRSARPAVVRDVMTPGDALATGQEALADLRFNDGSLARLGEQVVFRFLPQTRTFRLSNGTVLLLIPPGQGGTRIQTPNVTTGIRGSALFVRYDAATDTTLVGALTNSGIEVSNANASQQQVLAAGQMVVVVGDEIRHLYDFDLSEFYQTSYLVQGLSLDAVVDRTTVEEAAIALVREETLAALAWQSTRLAEEPWLTPSATALPDFIALTPLPLWDNSLPLDDDLPVWSTTEGRGDRGTLPSFVAASVFTLFDAAEFRSTDMLPTGPEISTIVNPPGPPPLIENPVVQPPTDSGPEISPPLPTPTDPAPTPGLPVLPDPNLPTPPVAPNPTPIGDADPPTVSPVAPTPPTAPTPPVAGPIPPPVDDPDNNPPSNEAGSEFPGQGQGVEGGFPGGGATGGEFPPADLPVGTASSNGVDSSLLQPEPIMPSSDLLNPPSPPLDPRFNLLNPVEPQVDSPESTRSNVFDLVAPASD